MTDTIVASVFLNKGQKLTVSEDIAHKDIPYYKVGNGKTNKQGTSMNLIKLMTDLSKPEQVMIRLMEERLDPWNEFTLNCVRLPVSELSSTEVQYVNKAYKLLEGKNMIKRVKREYYMFNPYLIIPPIKQKEAEALWDSLHQG